MGINTESEILLALKHDLMRMKVVEAASPAIQAKYVVGIEKLRRRIHEERDALGLLPEDTEAWTKHLLDGVDYYRSEGTSRLVNQYLEMVEEAREAANLAAMREAQQGLERLIQEITEPNQMQFGT